MTASFTRTFHALHSGTQMPEAGSGLREPARSVAIVAVLAAMALVVLDGAIANVALPSIARSLHLVPAVAVGVVTAYQAALLVGLLPCAALGESIGYRRVFTAGVAVFTVASAGCMLAPSLSWLLAARFMQGLGGAAIMALGIALMRFAVPPGRFGAIIGWNALTVAVSSAIGPAGAAILSLASWPWLFVVNLPLGALAFVASRALPKPAGTACALDLASIALNTLVFTSLIAGAELLPAAPALAGILLAAAAAGLVTLVRRELPKDAPLVPLDLLRLPSLRISAIASVCCFAGVSAGMVALPFYLQHELGQSALMTGLYLTTWPVTVAIVAPMAGYLADRVQTAWLCVSGAACLAAGLAGACLWPLHGNPAPLALFTALCGLGFGLFNVPNNRNMFLASPRARSGAAGGLQGMARLIGQTSGAVIMTLLFTVTAAGAAPRLGLAIGAVLALFAGVVSAIRA